MTYTVLSGTLTLVYHTINCWVLYSYAMVYTGPTIQNFLIFLGVMTSESWSRREYDNTSPLGVAMDAERLSPVWISVGCHKGRASALQNFSPNPLFQGSTRLTQVYLEKWPIKQYECVCGFICWSRFLQVRCPSFHPTNNVKHCRDITAEK